MPKRVESVVDKILKVTESKWFRGILSFISIGCTGLLLWAALFFTRVVEKEIYIYPETEEVYEQEDWDVETTVRYFISLYNLNFPHIVYAQFIVETGYGTSNKCLYNYNCFGMRVPKTRPTTCIAQDTQGYAVYNSIETSIIDYMLWQHLYGAETEEEYLAYLSNYAKDPDYRKKIEFLMKLW